MFARLGTLLRGSALLIVACWLVAQGSLAFGYTVTVSNAQGIPGQTGIVVTVSLDDVNGIDIFSTDDDGSGFDFPLQFDSSVLQVSDVRLSTFADSECAGTCIPFFAFDNISNPGTVEFAVVFLPPGITGSGQQYLIEIVFDVENSAAPGAYTLLLEDFYLNHTTLGFVDAGNPVDGTFQITQAVSATGTLSLGLLVVVVLMMAAVLISRHREA